MSGEGKKLRGTREKNEVEIYSERLKSNTILVGGRQRLTRKRVFKKGSGVNCYCFMTQGRKLFLF